MTDTWKQIISFESLYRAAKVCRRSVMWKDATARWCANGLKEIYRLRQELLDGTYQIRRYHCFVVTDPKRREVMATSMRDRVFQRSMCDNYLYHALTKGLIRDNFACQKGRGVDDALDRMDAHLHRYYRHNGADGWVLKCDIRKYFASTRHDVAKAAVRKRVSDDHVYQAVCQIIDSFGADGVGIGLGSQVSQLVELCVLDDMDHMIKERLRVKHYLRYMDDFVLIHPDKEFLLKCWREIEAHLAEIGLELNQKTQLSPLAHGVKWLKWRFVLTDSGRVVRYPARGRIIHERRKLRRIHGLVVAGRVDDDLPVVSFVSWAASTERHQFRTNRRRRSTGRSVKRTPSSLAVDQMRRRFFSLYGYDPYHVR